MNRSRSFFDTSDKVTFAGNISLLYGALVLLFLILVITVAAARSAGISVSGFPADLRKDLLQLSILVAFAYITIGITLRALSDRPALAFRISAGMAAAHALVFLFGLMPIPVLVNGGTSIQFGPLVLALIFAAAARQARSLLATQ